MKNFLKTGAGLAILLAIGCAPGVRDAAATVHRQPGSWRMLQYSMDFDANGVDDGLANMVATGKALVGKKQFGGPVCLSTEAAGKDDLTTRLNEAIHFGPEWKVIRSEMKDGKIDFLATMNDPQNGKAEMTITGQITPTTTDLIVTTDSHLPAPGKGHIHTVSKQENTRVGDCTAGEESWS